MEFITLMLAFAVLEETELPSNGTRSLFYIKLVIALPEVLQIPSWFSSSFCAVFAVEQEHSWSWAAGTPVSSPVGNSCHEDDQIIQLGHGDIEFKACPPFLEVSQLIDLCDTFLNQVFWIPPKESFSNFCVAIGPQREQELGPARLSYMAQVPSC